jgi:hypothetical protein
MSKRLTKLLQEKIAKLKGCKVSMSCDSGVHYIHFILENTYYGLATNSQYGYGCFLTVQEFCNSKKQENEDTSNQLKFKERTFL